jgi:hypothetical protein
MAIPLYLFYNISPRCLYHKTSRIRSEITCSTLVFVQRNVNDDGIDISLQRNLSLTRKLRISNVQKNERFLSNLVSIFHYLHLLLIQMQ